MTTKLRMDLGQGVIEAEGSEEFVKSLYADFKEQLASARVPPKSPAPTGHQPPAAPLQSDARESSRKPAKKAAKKAPANGAGKPKKRAALGIVKDLDLSRGKNGRLKEFYAKYEVKTNFERNLVFVYYMEHELGLEGITCDHVFTCYRDVGAKLPTALKQSLADTSSRAGWLDTSDMGNIRVSTPGVNHLEHDLPRKATDA